MSGGAAGLRSSSSAEVYNLIHIMQYGLRMHSSCSTASELRNDWLTAHVAAVRRICSPRRSARSQWPGETLQAVKLWALQSIGPLRIVLCRPVVFTVPRCNVRVPSGANVVWEGYAPPHPEYCSSLRGPDSEFRGAHSELCGRTMETKPLSGTRMRWAPIVPTPPWRFHTSFTVMDTARLLGPRWQPRYFMVIQHDVSQPHT